MSVCRLQLPTGEWVYYNEEDVELIEAHRWRRNRSSRDKTSYAYADIRKSGRRITVKMHRLILNAPPGVQVDHVDGNGLNNVRSNIRLATPSQNTGNRRLSVCNTTGYKGVSWDKGTGKWRARIKLNDKERHLGLFNDPWEAAQAYNHAALEQWGEFAYLNVKHEDTNKSAA